MSDPFDRHRSRAATVARRALVALGVLAALVLPAAPALASALTAEPEGDQPVEITLYWGDGCPRCEEELEWLAEVGQDYDLVMTEFEVWEDSANRERFIAAGSELGFEASAVPVTVIERRVWIGFTDAIADDIADAISLAAAGELVPAGVYGTADAGTCDADELQCDPGDTGASVDVPFIGEVDLGGKSLLVSTLIIGFVDGVNPCSLWVISVLLTIVVRTASRRRVVAIGSTFLLITAGMYALYMAGIYSALTVVGFLGVIQWVVAIAAGVFGIVSIKDYFAFKQGLSFTISDSAKPGIYQRMRRAAGHHKLVPALAATVALGVAVSLLETPCTAGFPVLWTGLLQANNVGFAEAAGLFVAYMIPFLLDEMIVFGIAVATMRAAKLQEKHGELLKLFAGVTMVVLAAVMAINPTLMESPVIALVLFTAAFAAAALVHVVAIRLRVEQRLRLREAARASAHAETVAAREAEALAAQVRSMAALQEAWEKEHPGQPMPAMAVAPAAGATIAGNNVLAVLALVFGLIGSGVVAVVLGHMARGQIRRTGERGDGMAIAGLVLGYLGLAILVAYLVAVVGVLRSLG